MDAKGLVVDRSRALRLALLGVVAGGAAVVCGMLLGGSHASAADQSGVLDDVLGGATQSLVDTTGAVGSVATQTLEVASPVVAAATAPVAAVATPIVEPVVAPIAPVVQPVAAQLTHVVEAVPTLTSVVTPVATQVDAVVAAVPVVRDLVGAPATSVVVPVVGAVDEVLDGTVDAVQTPSIGIPPVGIPQIDGSAVDAIADGDPVLVADGAGTVGASPTGVAPAIDADALGPDAQPILAGADARAEVLAVTRGLLAEAGTLSATVPGGAAAPAPVDERGALAPAASGQAPSAAFADTTHDAQRSLDDALRALAGDDLLPTSVVGDHDSSPD
ncbi:hypothetical protein GCM10009846_17690 [Agrococcus versicolor]|uniref:Uncharacterized protein n=1 Tax=Agrococcus versicolor TaxID=501482 RepID=A0ABN3ASI6_9MICO